MATRSGQTARAGAGAARGPFGPDLRVGSGRDEVERALFDACRTAARDVLGELWEADVERLCGERWKPRPRAKVTRAGWCACQITLGGERISLRRPRVRSVKGREIELPAFKAAAARDLLDRGAVEDVAASITTGTFPPGRHAREPIAAEFVELLAARMAAVHAMPRTEFGPGLLVAPVDFPDQSFIGAVAIASDGTRSLAGLRAGSASDPASVTAFLTDVMTRHRRSDPPEICFVGEDEAVHEALRGQFGRGIALQRSPQDKRRRVLALLPPSLQSSVLESLLDAYEVSDARAAERALRSIHKTLASDHPEAAAALLDGLDETLTLHRLGGRERRPRPPGRTSHSTA